jgi:hypothetical protein
VNARAAGDAELLVSPGRWIVTVSSESRPFARFVWSTDPPATNLAISSLAMSSLPSSVQFSPEQESRDSDCSMIVQGPSDPVSHLSELRHRYMDKFTDAGAHASEASSARRIAHSPWET